MCKLTQSGLEDKLLLKKKLLDFTFQTILFPFMKNDLNKQVQRYYLNYLTDQKGAVGVYITSVKKIRTKKGDSMAFLTVSDSSGEMEAVVFPDSI